MKTSSKVKRVGMAEWRGMEETIDAQLQTLAERKCPVSWISRLEQGAAPALAFAAKRYRYGVEWPLLAVVPIGCLSLRRLLRLVVLRGLRTRTVLPEEQLFSFFETPQNPYWLISVDVGVGNLGIAPGLVANQALKHRRRALTVSESVALCVHEPRILKTLAIWAGGSYYEENAFDSPTVYWQEGEGPWLGVGERDKGERDFGTPTADVEVMIECCPDGRARIWKSKCVKQ